MPNRQKIKIPRLFREFANGTDFLSVEAETIAIALTELWTRFPLIKAHMVDKSGELNRFTCVFVNKEDIRFLNYMETQLQDGDEIFIIPPYIASSTAIAAISVASTLRDQS